MLAATNSTLTWCLHHDDVKMRTPTRSVERLFNTRTIPPYDKTISVLSGYAPSLAKNPVQIKVEYSRSVFVSAKVTIHIKSAHRLNPTTHLTAAPPVF